VDAHVPKYENIVRNMYFFTLALFFGLELTLFSVARNVNTTGAIPLNIFTKVQNMYFFFSSKAA
jgi:hypothetical protein